MEKDRPNVRTVGMLKITQHTILIGFLNHLNRGHFHTWKQLKTRTGEKILTQDMLRLHFQTPVILNVHIVDPHSHLNGYKKLNDMVHILPLVTLMG
jgi:hypothetical protein